MDTPTPQPDPRPAHKQAWSWPRFTRNAVVIVGVVALGVLAWIQVLQPNLFPKNFGVVREGQLYRAGVLTPRAFQKIVHEHGVRTVVDLGANHPGSPGELREQSALDALGVERVSLRLFGDAQGDPNEYVRALRVMTDSQRGPVLVHCAAGAQRTGAAVAFYRMLIEGTSLDDAMAEAQQYRHDPQDNPHLREMLVKLHERCWIQYALVLLACAAVSWPLLGRGGLAMTEAHRVIPAWEMLDSGDWLTPRMFGKPYLRKPPGMSWAVGVSSMALGQTELAARVVSATSATIMALVALAFGRRWFGARWGLGAGLAQALAPIMWESARSAEIEALHTLGLQLAALASVDLLTNRAKRAAPLMCSVLGLGVIVAGLSKGPVGAPVLLGVVGAGVIVRRSWRPLVSPWLWAGLIAGVAAVGGVLAAMARALGDEPAVMPLTGSHLWSGGVLPVLALAPTAFMYALPASLALLLPWGPDARREGETSEREGEMLATARVLAWAWALALAVWLGFGVTNPRYVMGGIVLITPLASYALRGAFRDGAFTPLRARIARLMLLGRPAVWVFVLVGAGWVYIGSREAGVRASSGRDAGRLMGQALVRSIEDGGTPLPAVLVADDAVEARPEVLGEVRRVLRSAGYGDEVSIRWTPWDGASPPPEPWDLVLIRVDKRSLESEGLKREIDSARLGLLDEQSVSKYILRLYLRRQPSPDPG
eukprot:g5483.t1